MNKEQNKSNYLIRIIQFTGVLPYSSNHKTLINF